MTPADITEAMVRQRVDRRIFERGKAYFEDDVVDRLVLRGDTLTAEVYGSEDEPYEVSVRFGTVDIADADCTCPYGAEFGGWCKHIVAALLAAADAPEAVTDAPPVTALLEGASRDELAQLLLTLVERHPDLADEIALWRAAPPVAANNSAAAVPPVNVAAIRERLREEFRHARRHYEYGDTTLSSLLSQLSTQASERAYAGDPVGALAILETVLESYIGNDWPEFDHEGDFDFSTVGEAFALALLDPDLPAKTRSALLPKLRAWQESLDNYGGGELDEAVRAAQSGWDDPGLRAALSGALATPPSETERLLAGFRVEILERRGRRDEALNVALWAGRTKDACLLLVALGRHDEAAAYGAKRLESAQERLEVAQALHAAGARAVALRLAEAGLDTPGVDEREEAEDADEDDGPMVRQQADFARRFSRDFAASYYRYPLAQWLRDAAAADGEKALAIRAGAVAVVAHPTLVDWQRLADLAGDDWSGRRDELLDALASDRRGIAAEGRVDVLLQEGRTLDAWNLVRDGYSRSLTLRVAAVAATLAPDDVAKVSRTYAEEIMDSGSSGRYEEARDWLDRVRAAMRYQGKDPEWREYLASQMQRHARKYKLMPLLRELH